MGSNYQPIWCRGDGVCVSHLEIVVELGGQGRLPPGGACVAQGPSKLCDMASLTAIHRDGIANLGSGLIPHYVSMSCTRCSMTSTCR